MIYFRVPTQVGLPSGIPTKKAIKSLKNQKGVLLMNTLERRQPYMYTWWKLWLRSYPNYISNRRDESTN